MRLSQAAHPGTEIQRLTGFFVAIVARYADQMSGIALVHDPVYKRAGGPLQLTRTAPKPSIMLSVHDHGAPPPCPAPFNLAAYVLSRAAEQPDKVALSILGFSGSARWRYGQLESAVRGTGTGLLRAGLVPGDHVLMRLGNDVEFPIAYLGAIAAGLVPVPSSAQLTTPEVRVLIEAVKPAAILHDPGIVCPQDTGARLIGTETLLAMRDMPPVNWDMGDPDRPAYIVFTSGTAGRPRPVVHAHRAIWARRMMRDGWHAIRPGDRILHAGAFNWTYTLGTGLMDPWTLGATALIPATGVTPKQLPLLLARHDATIFAAAPGVYRKMLRTGTPLRLPKLRHGLSAGEKLSDGICADWEAATGTKVHEAYGMTECSTFISASPFHPAASGTLGRPQKGRRVAILGSGGPVARGTEGMIAVHRGDPGLMLGYLGEPEATAARFSGDWFVTGDHGTMDDDGAFTYLGREDDMMNAGGYRVSPLEVEAALARMPVINEIAVTDVEVRPDARVIMAFYTATEPVPPDTLDAHAATCLARYKRPRGYVHLGALPTGANGKIKRRALRTIYKDLHDQA